MKCDKQEIVSSNPNFPLLPGFFRDGNVQCRSFRNVQGRSFGREMRVERVEDIIPM